MVNSIIVQYTQQLLKLTMLFYIELQETKYAPLQSYI